MPGKDPSGSPIHDWLFVAAVALGAIGLGATAAALDPFAQPRPQLPAVAAVVTSPSQTSGGSNVSSHRSEATPACPYAPQTCTVRETPERSRPGSDDSETRQTHQTHFEPAARRTYLLGSAAVAHRRVWVYEYVATPPAPELQAVSAASWQP